MTFDGNKETVQKPFRRTWSQTATQKLFNLVKTFVKNYTHLELIIYNWIYSRFVMKLWGYSCPLKLSKIAHMLQKTRQFRRKGSIPQILRSGIQTYVPNIIWLWQIHSHIAAATWTIWDCGLRGVVSKRLVVGHMGVTACRCYFHFCFLSRILSFMSIKLS